VFKVKNEEHLEQCAFFEWLKLAYPEIYKITFAIPNGGKRDIGTATKLKKEGVKAGVPDIFIAHANSVAHGVFIEMKSRKGRVTEAQFKMHELLEQNGYHVYICNRWTLAKEIIEIEFPK